MRLFLKGSIHPHHVVGDLLAVRQVRAYLDNAEDPHRRIDVAFLVAFCFSASSLTFPASRESRWWGGVCMAARGPSTASATSGATNEAAAVV